MTVKSITFLEEVDNSPADSYDYEGSQYVNQRIYAINNEDGTEQFLSVGVQRDSYGTEVGVAEVRLVNHLEKTVTVWE